MVTSLIDALQVSGLLRSVPVPTTATLYRMLVVDVPELDPGGGLFDLHVAAGPLRGTLHGVAIAAGAGPLSASVVVPLAGASLVLETPAGPVTLTGTEPGTLTVTIDADGVRCLLSAGPVAVVCQPAVLRLTGHGGVAIEVEIATVKLDVVAGELVADASGSLRVRGVPELAATTVSLSLHWDQHGFRGSASETPGLVSATVGWAPDDPLPAEIDLAARFDPPTTATPLGVGVQAGPARLRARLHRTGGSTFDLEAAVEAGDGGVLSSGDAKVAVLAIARADPPR